MGTTQPKYDENFNRSIVTLCQNDKTQTQISKEYGVSSSTICHWVKLYSEVKIDDETVITAQQVKELQKRNALLEEENLTLKKSDCLVGRLARRVLEREHGSSSRVSTDEGIFTPHSEKG